MHEGALVAKGYSEQIVTLSELQELKAAIRDLQRLLGRKQWQWRSKMMLSVSPVKKTDIARALAQEGQYPMKSMTDIVGVSQSNQDGIKKDREQTCQIR